MIFNSEVDLASWEWYIWEIEDVSGYQDKESELPAVDSINSPRLLTRVVTWWCNRDLKSDDRLQGRQQGDSPGDCKSIEQGNLNAQCMGIKGYNKHPGLAPWGKISK